MPDQFTGLTKADIKELLNFYKRLPKAFKRVSAGVLNSMAFADRTQIPKTMNQLMTIRTPSIIKKATRVQMAKASDPINKQHSISGSIKIPGHDAWEHVQTGKSTRVTQFTDAGRIGGSQERVAKKAAKAGQAFTKETDFKLKGGGEKKVQQYLQAIKTDKKRRRKSFYIKQGLAGMQRGIYQFVGGSVRKGKLLGAKIKRLSTPKAKVTPKAIDWKGKTTRKAVTESKVHGWWVSGMKRELKKVKPRKR